MLKLRTKKENTTEIDLGVAMLEEKIRFSQMRRRLIRTAIVLCLLCFVMGFALGHILEIKSAGTIASDEAVLCTDGPEEKTAEPVLMRETEKAVEPPEHKEASTEKKAAGSADEPAESEAPITTEAPIPETVHVSEPEPDNTELPALSAEKAEDPYIGELKTIVETDIYLGSPQPEEPTRENTATKMLSPANKTEEEIPLVSMTLSRSVQTAPFGEQDLEAASAPEEAEILPSPSPDAAPEKEPVPEKKVEPAKEPVSSIDNSSEPKQTHGKLEKIGKYRITAYCPCEKCCGDYAKMRPDGKVYGASGVELKAGLSVASPLDFGTRVYIPGLGEYEVQDRTADWVAEGCNYRIIDIFMLDHQEASDFGVRNVDVYRVVN